VTAVSETEIARRYRNLREAMQAHRVTALIVCGSEYTGFEGAMRYVSGFRIVHRYAYTLLPLQGDAYAIFPSEARYVGDHGEAWVPEQIFADSPGEWMAKHLEARRDTRVAVAGLDYVMPVRDYAALAGRSFELIGFDEQFDLARAAKSEEELIGVRDTMAINESGFWAVHAAYAPGRTQAELMAAAEAEFARRGTGRQTMDMVLWGRDGSAEPEFRIPESVEVIQASDLLLFSLEIAGPAGYWGEFARPLCSGSPSSETSVMLEGYDEYFEATRLAMRAGATAHDVHRAASKPFSERGLGLGHVTGHSIGMTMLEHPRIGEGVETVLEKNMVISMHPHVIGAGGRSCLYMQDTWLVGADGGQLLSSVPARIFDGSEPDPREP
jgi:Xaa-Pro dipeptidase